MRAGPGRSESSGRPPTPRAPARQRRSVSRGTSCVVVRAPHCALSCLSVASSPAVFPRPSPRDAQQGCRCEGMAWRRAAAALFVCAVSAPHAGAQSCVAAPPQAGFQPRDYEGTWYEIGKIQTFGGAIFESSCVCTQLIVAAAAAPVAPGDATVLNSCRDKTPQGAFINASAQLVNMAPPGHWDETFVPPEWKCVAVPPRRAARRCDAMRCGSGAPSHLLLTSSRAQSLCELHGDIFRCRCRHQGGLQRRV